ncbi:hypothetical protein HG530_011330 [Fusarium avenaceum]|nr:hypothetical protein HG530_011330 [Fusarium avenaceum]
MNGNIDITLNEEVVDGLDILVLAGVGSSENSAHTDGVLVTQINSLIGIHNESIRRAVDELLVNLKVASGLFPTDLDSRGHDDVGVLGALTLSLSAVLPALLHGQHSKHDSF